MSEARSRSNERTCNTNTLTSTMKGFVQLKEFPSSLGTVSRRHQRFTNTYTRSLRCCFTASGLAFGFLLQLRVMRLNVHHGFSLPSHLLEAALTFYMVLPVLFPAGCSCVRFTQMETSSNDDKQSTSLADRQPWTPETNNAPPVSGVRIVSTPPVNF